MGWQLFNGVTLWLGMYAITATLFFIETGNIVTALTFALIGSTLKTLWSLLHKCLTHKHPTTPIVVEESFASIDKCVQRKAA